MYCIIMWDLGSDGKNVFILERRMKRGKREQKILVSMMNKKQEPSTNHEP